MAPGLSGEEPWVHRTLLPFTAFGDRRAGTGWWSRGLFEAARRAPQGVSAPSLIALRAPGLALGACGVKGRSATLSGGWGGLTVAASPSATWGNPPAQLSSLTPLRVRVWGLENLVGPAARPC